MSTGHTFDFIALQKVLLDWSSLTLPVTEEEAENPILKRLLQILHETLSIGALPSDMDFVTLIRHLLLSRSRGSTYSDLLVPEGEGWPNAEVWRRCSFTVTAVAGGLIVTPSPWKPDWLGNSAENADDIFMAEFAGEVVRQAASVPIDPFLSDASGYDDYLCPGQREAVRSLLFLPPGDTLIVNLPTGAGKSLVGVMPVLCQGLYSGLTLFVVPTTALALDLARRLLELLRRRHSRSEIPELVWHGGCSEDVKQGIKQRIRQGNQGILFTSPEAMTGSLLPSLHEAASKGSLKYLVIDEAHLVAQWGDSFRPAFQALSGVRRGLFRSCEGELFRTVLMSATFSPQTMATLDALFGPPKKVQMVSAVHLRPEPRYFSYHAQSWGEKRERVLELLLHSPRPFILYVTERQHCEYWLRILKHEGYRRIACFHGNTPNERREEIIHQWVHDQLDGVVATSAFGVGMDKQDVRTVIHAAIPETLDRYYQEVGRGGRDGRASLSVVIYSYEDEIVARNMSKPAIIGRENAFERWQFMFESAQRVADNDLSFIDIKVLPRHLYQESDFNVDWNMRTLILMARAGLIELESRGAELIERLIDEDDEEYETRLDAFWENYFTTLPVRTLDPRNLERDYFEHAISSERDRGIQAAERSFENLMAALRGEREMSHVLSELFKSDTPERTVFVSSACRGCPAVLGNQHAGDLSYQIPIGVGIDRVVEPQIELWQQRFSRLGFNPVVILCTGIKRGPNEQVFRALAVLVSMFGVREISATAEQWRKYQELRTLNIHTPDRVLIARTLEEDKDNNRVLPIPKATLLLPWPEQPIPNHIFFIDRPLHVIFAPENLPSSHPQRLYRDVAMNCVELDEFLRIATR